MAELEAFRRELDAFLDETLSDEGQQRIFVSLARDTLEEFEAAWRSRQPGARFDRRVDGSSVKALEEVTIPGGVVFERVQTIAPMVRRALQLFDQLTKVVTGGYKSQTFVFAGAGRARGVAALNNDDNFVVIANVSSFARKAERQGFNIARVASGGDGLFETIGAIMRREFANTANAVYFTYRTIEGNRVPVLAIGGAARFAGQRREGFGPIGRR